MKKIKTQKGITLVALIITIIVLLILAVVAINAVQNDGIIEYAKNARDEYEKAQDKEEAAIEHLLGKIETGIGNGIVHNGLIPEGAIYKTSEGTVLTEFPKEVKDGDIYQYGDYEYCYNKYYMLNKGWMSYDPPINGWGVKIKDEVGTGEISYGEILTTINNINVKSLSCTFSYCSSMQTAPVLPNTITDMRSTFLGCSELKEVPIIPESVTNMNQTFANCLKITTAPVIPEKVTNMKSTFVDCYELSGEIFIKAKDAETSLCFWGTKENIWLIGINEDENDDKYDNKNLLDALVNSEKEEAPAPYGKDSIDGNVKIKLIEN